MKRPHLTHFLAIKTHNYFSVRASLNMKESFLNAKEQAIGNERRQIPTFPLQNLRLLKSHEFTLKIIGYSKNQTSLFEKYFESDSFGNFNFKIPLTEKMKEISHLEIFETAKEPGLEFYLGTQLPLVIQYPKKLVICDFDKTLVDTKYSSTKEVYNSLTRPVEHFPTIDKSVELIKSYIEKGHHPFILSASPHFYETAIRDWLYKKKIYTAGIFLKDYREVFSFSGGDLLPKDIKMQGIYKLNHLLDILIMTGVPDHLVLMGDNFESDPIIYLTLASILLDTKDPWSLWNSLKAHESFKFSQKQNSQFLNKIFQIQTILARRKSNTPTEIKILIRKKLKEDHLKIDSKLFADKLHLIDLYDAPSTSRP